jgi:hypothetical protein
VREVSAVAVRDNKVSKNGVKWGDECMRTMNTQLQQYLAAPRALRAALRVLLCAAMNSAIISLSCMLAAGSHDVSSSPCHCSLYSVLPSGLRLARILST